ncbi:MAG: OmpA family protein [Kofleriaceae bacterium]
MGSRTVRAGAVVLAMLYVGTAYAGPYVEGSAFFGADDFGPQIALGGALAPEQRPQTSPLFGVRLTAMLVRTVVFDLGVEPELVFTPAWTGYGFDGPRDSYFAPVFGYRGSLILRTRSPHAVRFHALAGIGGATVVSKSPYMTTDTDPILYYGAGATLSVGGGWEMRLDGRQGFMPARTGGSTAIYEGMLGIGLSFGAFGAGPAPVVEHPRVAVRPPLPPPDPDRDGDGVPDRLDHCPDQAMTPGGVDGCPLLDRDHDGIADAHDKCPDQPEDKDGFQDDDGCPDLDNDADGIPDDHDKCPDLPETKNGYQDDDGCPDELPAALVAAFGTASAVRFEPSRARLTEAAKATLAKTVPPLHANPKLHVFVIGHPDAKGDPAKTGPLANKRAEAVKWYLVDQGVPADQLETATGAPAEQGRVIELRIGSASPH